MKSPSRIRLSQAVFGGAVLALLAIHPTSANIIFAEGNVSTYTGVNFDPTNPTGLTVNGNIGNSGIYVTFEDMIAPNGTPNILMHAQHGAASVENALDSGQTIVGFKSVMMVAEPGTGWTAGDFKLDQLNGSTGSLVTLTGISSDGTFTQQFPIAANGQNPYNFTTTGGEIVTSITFAADLLADVKSVSLAAVPGPIVGAGLPGLVVACGALLALARRRRTGNGATAIAAV